MSPAKHSFAKRRQGQSAITILCGITLICVGWSGCNQSSTEATDVATATTIQSASTVKLTEALIERAGIRTEPVVRGTFRTFLDFPGAVKADEHKVAEVVTLVRGRVVEVYKTLGDDVQAGDLLTLLFSRELGLAQSNYLKAIAGLRVADQAFKRAKYLLDEKVIGKGEFQRREGQLLSARAEANESKDQLILLGMTAQDIARLERDQTIRSHVPIVAPLSGRIIARDLTKGEVVETTRHLFTIANLDKVWVVANVPEQDISFIHTAVRQSTTAEVLLTAYPNEPIKGQVTYVGDVLRPDTRTLALRVEVPNPDGRLKPEMFGTVRIWTPDVADVLTISSAAVQRDRGKTVVFVQLNEGQFSRRVVEVGERNGQQVKIVDGLQEGEHVVVAGAFVVRSEFANQHRGGLAE
jgi:cobalt-zinc-cadmium efflux system membrane fusion protein